MKDRLAAIHAQTFLLEQWLAEGTDPFSVPFAQQLTELLILVEDANRAIDDEWRRRNAALLPRRKAQRGPLATVDDLI